ncbi:hypothetical protein Y032_0750g2045 [Ancylostoma ceylanicum]|uniref:Uncharacterized protein n=1 Tax=Ancylostoma ceylanicum TaxID=53326 RepID=A0A016WEJ6_9BILA|nr:hypothetical protein Y032_0750g2045 [Ancylostoma ceylanicum]
MSGATPSSPPFPDFYDRSCKPLDLAYSYGCRDSPTSRERLRLQSSYSLVTWGSSRTCLLLKTHISGLKENGSVGSCGIYGHIIIDCGRVAAGFSAALTRVSHNSSE